MHSLGHTFAHSSQPMHLYQSIECCPRYAFGSSTRSYGYRTVTGFRRKVAASACFIVIHMGRRVPPITPTLPPSPDLGDFKGVFSLLHVEQLALAGAHEASLLRPHEARLLRANLLAELQEAVDEGLRAHGAAGDEDVRRDERVGALHHGVRIVVGPPADRAFPHSDDPFRLRHLFIETPNGGADLGGDRPRPPEDIPLPGGWAGGYPRTRCGGRRGARRRPPAPAS